VLQPGEVRVFPVGGGEPKRWQVEGGFLSFDSNHLTIVADNVVEGARPATSPATH
jgi:F-type H+-transporting ATPase subunit epsilon